MVSRCYNAYVNMWRPRSEKLLFYNISLIIKFALIEEVKRCQCLDRNKWHSEFLFFKISMDEFLPSFNSLTRELEA